MTEPTEEIKDIDIKTLTKAQKKVLATRKWRENNKERSNEYQRLYIAKTREESRKYREMMRNNVDANNGCVKV